LALNFRTPYSFNNTLAVNFNIMPGAKTMNTKQYMIGDMNTKIEIRMASFAGSKGGIHVKSKPVKVKVAVRR